MVRGVVLGGKPTSSSSSSSSSRGSSSSSSSSTSTSSRGPEVLRTTPDVKKISLRFAPESRGVKNALVLCAG